MSLRGLERDDECDDEVKGKREVMDEVVSDDFAVVVAGFIEQVEMVLKAKVEDAMIGDDIVKNMVRESGF